MVAQNVNSSASIDRPVLVLDPKSVCIASIQIHNLFRKASLLYHFLEIRKRREHDIVITKRTLEFQGRCKFGMDLLIMNRNGNIWLKQLYKVEALLRVHSNHQEGH